MLLISGLPTAINTKENPRGLDGAMASMDKDVYSRTNKVFGVSVNYKF